MKRNVTWIPLFLAIAPVAQAQTSHPSDGQVIFSELFIAPPSSKTTYEYVELYSLASQPISVDGCYLLLSNPSKTCDDIPGLGTVTGWCREITATQDIAPNAYGLLIKDEDKWGPEGCDKTWVGTYASISMDNNDPETITLYCNPSGGADTYEPVANFSYDWANVPFAETGRTYQLRNDYLTLTDGAALDPQHWCTAPDDAWMCAFDDNGTTRNMYGTPGTASVCEPEIRYPAAGEVIINEINAWPGTSSLSPDWLELEVLFAPTEAPNYNLKGCRIGVVNCTSDDPEACLNVSQDYAQDDTLGTLFTLSQGQLVVVADEEGACVRVNADPTDGVEDGTCEREADLFMNVSLSTDNKLRRIDLNCPDDGAATMHRVDSVVYNYTWAKETCCQPDGHCSWELRTVRLDGGTEPPHLANDLPDNWGVAPASEAYVTGIDDTGATPAPEASYGSPGETNGVGAPPVLVPPGPGDVIFTELAAWPSTSTTSPDWIELQVVGDPGTARFDLTGCLMRTIDCDDLGLDTQACIDATWADTDWSKTDDMEATECAEASPLWLAQGDLALIGNSASKTCLATDDTGACTRSVVAQVSSTVALPSGTRLLELACPDDTGGAMVAVDRVVYNATWLTPTCAVESGHCSWALRPDGLSSQDAAEANDDPTAWTTEVTAYRDPDGNAALGTPGAPNTVAGKASVSGPPAPGDVFVNEIMVDYGTTPEWVELQAAEADSPFELAGCYLLLDRPGSTGGSGGEATPAPSECNPTTPEDCYKAYQIPPEVHFPIGAGNEGTPLRRVLARSICLSHGVPVESTPTPGPDDTMASECTLLADLNVGSALDFSSSTEEALSLWCPGSDDTSDYQLIDRFQYDWSEWDDLCADTDGEPVTACSLAVHQEHANADDNDCDFYRCVSSASERGYYDTKGNLCAGSPGQENTCPPIPHTPRGPAAGPDARVLVIDEIAPMPAGDSPDVGRFSHEWFEIYNPGTETLDLGSCRFVLGNELGDDGFVTDPSAEYDMAADPVSIEPGDYQLWAVDGCLMGSFAVEPDTTPTPAPTETPPGGDVAPKLQIRDTCDVPADVAYESLSFPNTTPKYFQLVCRVGCGEEEVIDTVLLDAEGQGLEEGHSWQLDPAYLDVEANDDPAHWCQGSYQQVFGYEALGKNYGTPGEPNECIPPPDCGDVVVGCRCDYDARGDGSDQWATVFLTGLVLVGLRRRARSRR